MPQVFVDGMNVIGARPDGWWRDRDGAVRRLLKRLQALGHVTDDRITVVFDGRALVDLPEGVHGGVRVLYAPKRSRGGADDRIVEELRAEDQPREVRVVTSDRELAQRVRILGARVEGAGALWTRLDDLADR
jgi:predicted RNA-binding protein with PIN domain